MVDISEYLIDTELTMHSGAVASVHGFDADGKVNPQVHGSAKHTGTIGTESQITFVNTGGHAHTGTDSKVVAWSVISGRPTDISDLTDDLGFITGYCDYCSYCTYCAGYCTYCACDCECQCCK